MVCIRENTEGEYSGVGGRIHRGGPDEVAVQTAVFTRKGVERVLRYAFELARTRPAKSLASGMGGSSAVNSDGTVTTALSVGGNNYSDVNSALTAVNNAANAGWAASAGKCRLTNPAI